MEQIKLLKTKSKLRGTIDLSGSKSISNRLLIMRALAGSKILFDNLSPSSDTRSLRYYLKFIESCASSAIPMVIDTANAGTVLRFLTAYLSIKEGDWLLTGSARMKERPVLSLVSALKELGAEISFTEKENFPPLRISGSDIEGEKVKIDASASSQFVTALMLIAPYLENGLQIEFTKKPVSFSYIEMTQKLMQEFGIRVHLDKNSVFVEAGAYQVKPFFIEPDWSSASYWYEMVALSDDADIFLKGLRAESVQGDHVMTTIFEKLGVETSFEKEGIRLTNTGNPTTAFSYDFSSCPDLVPAVLASCAGKGIPAVVSGVKHLQYKESDRMDSMRTELQKTGCQLKNSGNSFELIPSSQNFSQTACVFDSHNDHRIAMALAPLALKLASVSINNPEVVEKSYPGFWDDLYRLGIKSKSTSN